MAMSGRGGDDGRARPDGPQDWAATPGLKQVNNASPELLLGMVGWNLSGPIWDWESRGRRSVGSCEAN
jgi:hypothetical protein